MIAAFVLARTLPCRRCGDKTMKTRASALLLCLSALLLSPALFAASWSSVSGNKPNWLVAGSGSALFAAEASFVYASNDSGKTWQSIGPAGSPYSALSFFNSQLWVGTQKKGAAYSTNQGGSWTTSATGMLSPLTGEAIQINAIAAKPGSTASLVAGALQGAYISSDGGATWTATVQGLPIIGTCPFCIKQAVHSVAGIAGNVLAGTAAGVYRSADGGANWTASGLSGSEVTMISVGGSSAYAIAYGAGLYKSTDSGATWTKLTGLSAVPSAILAHPGKTDVVFAGTAQGEVYSSTDGGTTWAAISDTSFSGAQVNALAVPPDQADNLVAATANGVFLYAAAAVTPSLVIPPATDAPLNTAITSDEVTVTGLTTATTISIVGGKYSLNGGVFTDQPGKVAIGSDLRVQVQSASTYDTSTTVTVTIGTLASQFVVTTIKRTVITNLLDVFTTLPPGAQIVDGRAVLSSTTKIALKDNPPAGVIIETTAGTPLTTKGGTLTLTDQSGGSSMTFVASNGQTVPHVAQGTFNIQSSVVGNKLGVGSVSSPSILTTTSVQDTLTINRGSTQTSAFVESGVVTLQFSGFASNGGRFAATTSIYGGETAEVTNRGGLSRIRIGSLAGDKGLPGDPVTLAGVTADTTVPKLDGTLARPNTASLITVIQDALNTQFGVTNGQVSYDSSRGIATYTANGRQYRFIPIGAPTVQLGTIAAAGGNRFAATNPASTASGAFSLAARGIQVTLASALGYFTDLNQALKALDANAAIKLKSSGVLQITLNSVNYVTSPGSSTTGGGQAATPAFLYDSSGYFAFQDSSGAVQSLYPVFADTTVADQTVKAIDPTGSVTDSGNGTAALRLLSNPYTLKPEYQLIPLPTAHASDLWWQEGPRLFLRYPDNTAQGFTLN